MKIPFLNKSFSSSFSSYSNSSSWAWSSCNQNPRTKSFRASIIAINSNDVEEEENERPLPTIIFSSSSYSIPSTIDAIEELQETESIESVIKGIKSSERLIFERKGDSKSILEETRNKDSCSCPYNQSTLSLISSGSWWRWLRYTRFIADREATKCNVKTTE